MKCQFLHENMQTAYIEVQETNGRFFTKTKNSGNYERECPYVRQIKNFDQNAMSAFLRENLQIAYIVVQETNGKLFIRKKEFGEVLNDMPLGSIGQEF